SPDALVGWSVSGSQLLRDGALRGADFVQRLAAGGVLARAEVGATPRDADAPARLRALQLAGILFGLVLLLTLSGEGRQLGINLFTAGALLIGLAALLLVRALHRLA